jgi:uncharacterized membrane protein YbhN (UPF0104 family)
VIASLLLIGGVWLLVARARQTGFDLADVWATISGSRMGWLAVAAALSLATYLGRVFRWAVLIRPLRPNPSILGLTSATVIGFTAIVLLGRPGELVRPWLIARNEKVTLSSQMAALLLERIYDMLAVLAIFGMALWQTGRSSTTNIGPKLQWLLEVGGSVAAIAALLCLTALVGLHRFAPILETRLIHALSFLEARHHERASRLIREALEALHGTGSMRSVSLLIFWSAVEWLLIVLVFIAAFQAFPQTQALTLNQVLIFIGFVAFGSIIQIPGIGGGVQIVSTLVLTELFHLPLDTAAAIALVIWILNFVVVVPIGLLLAFREGLQWSSLRQVQQVSTP